MNGMLCPIEGCRAFALSGRIPDHLHTQGDALGWSLVGLSLAVADKLPDKSPDKLPPQDTEQDTEQVPPQVPPQVTPTSTGKPRHPRQKYLLTVKGALLFNELIKN